jgi:hypothetical protein
MDLEGHGPTEGDLESRFDPGDAVGDDVVRHLLSRPRPPLVDDVTFEVIPGGYEVWYSDRLERDHADLVDQSADFLEDQLGVVNLGQIDHRVLIADGVLSDRVRDGLTAWWRERITDLRVE